MVKWILAFLLSLPAFADVASEFTGDLEAYQKSLPAGCQITSPHMKMIYACTRNNAPGSDATFYRVVEGKEANYCFSTLVIAEKSGSGLKVTTFRDEEKASEPRRVVYSADVSTLKQSGSGYLLPLNWLDGKCVPKDPKKSEVCESGIWSTANKVMVLKISIDKNDNLKQSITTNSEEIEKAQASLDAVTYSLDIDRENEDKLLVAFGRSQLLARARREAAKTSSTPADLLAYRMCDEALSKVMAKMKTPPEWTGDEKRLLYKLDMRISPTAAESRGKTIKN